MNITFFYSFLVLGTTALGASSVHEGESSALQKVSIDQRSARLQKEKSEFVSQEEAHRALVEKLTHQAVLLHDKLKTAQGTKGTFIQKQLSTLGQMQQVVAEILQEIQQIKTTIDQHSKLLEEWQSPLFYEPVIAEKSVYNFDDLQELERRFIDLQTRLSDAEKNTLSTVDDLAKRKKAVSTIEEEYRQKEHQQEEVKNGRSLEHDFSTNEQMQVLDEQKRLLNYKKDFAFLRIKEAEEKLSMLDTQTRFLRAKLSLIKDNYDRVKRGLFVDNSYVSDAEKRLAEKSKESLIIRTRFQDKLPIIGSIIENLRHKIEETKTRLNISASDAVLISEWKKDPKTATDWYQICSLGDLTAQESLNVTDRELIEESIQFEKAKLRDEEISVAIIRSWHKMTTRSGLRGEELIAQEIKSYDAFKAELQVDLKSLEDNRFARINDIHVYNTMFEKVKELLAQLKEEQLLFRNRANGYHECMTKLYDAMEYIRQRIGHTARLVEIYSSTLAKVHDSLKKIEGVVAELTAKSFWYRSSRSIEWRELRNVGPDIEHFLGDLRTSAFTYLSSQTFIAFARVLRDTLSSLSLLILLLLRLLIIVVAYLIIRALLPDISRYLNTIGTQYGIVASIGALGAVVIDFLQDHLLSSYSWAVVFFLIKTHFITDRFIIIIFYLFSIPFLIWLAYRFFIYSQETNQRRNYVLMSAVYERRFMMVVQPLMYATIGIFFFREAFLLGNYVSSPVPDVLLALNFILLQVAAVSLIGREQILSMIPSDTPLWEWIKEHVSKYYYVLWLGVIAIIIMSNPYVGYGRQVLYALSRLAITALLIPVLFWLHHSIKRASSDLFFYYADTETLKERFPSAKILYGLFMIGVLFLFGFIGIVMIARIWGRPLFMHEMLTWLNYELFSPGFDELNRRISISLLSFFKIGLYIIAGIGLTYLINSVILKRVFDPFFVGVGMQHAVLTLTRYSIVLLALFIGLHSVGLDTVATKVILVLGALSFAVKEPIADFFAYFILLVQRPIKIGDLIMVENTIGVVRYITPRSVLIRQRNSVTVVIPNYSIITKQVINWSYSRAYSSFNDFFLTVPYSADPEHVRKLIFEVLDKNTNILKTPAPVVWLNDFVDNGYQFLVRGFLTADKVYEQWDIASQVRLEIVRMLREHGIEIASPTRILRVMQSSSIEGTILPKDTQ